MVVQPWPNDPEYRFPFAYITWRHGADRVGERNLFQSWRQTPCYFISKMCQAGGRMLLNMVQDLKYFGFCFGWVLALFCMIYSLCTWTVCFLSVEVGSLVVYLLLAPRISALQDSQVISVQTIIRWCGSFWLLIRIKQAVEEKGIFLKQLNKNCFSLKTIIWKTIYNRWKKVEK